MEGGLGGGGGGGGLVMGPAADTRTVSLLQTRPTLDCIWTTWVLTVVFMMPVPWVLMELAMCRMLMVFRCLLLDVRSTNI